MITVGRDGERKPIGKIIGYYDSWYSAYDALSEYHKNPYDLDSAITVEELYKKWSDSYFEGKTASSVRTITSAWLYCSSISNMKAADVRVRHLKGCMEEGYRIEERGKNKEQKVYASANTKSRMKSLFNLMFDYALEYEIVDTNYARNFEISSDIVKEREDSKRGHIIFSESEISKLWEHVTDTPFVDWILIQCYTGFRPQELCILKLEDINLNKWTITGGMKTEAGKCRTIPIHSKIRDLVKKNCEYASEISSEYLLNDINCVRGGSKITYDKYAGRFEKVMISLNMNLEHRALDPRKTFITMAKKAGVDEYALKHIVGHKIQDITECSYTERDVEWLRTDIEKIK